MMMADEIKRSLQSDRTIDITTIGRKTGKDRRIEVWFYRADDRIYLTGAPGRRDWYANLLANPKFTFHLKQSLRADLPAFAKPIRDKEIKRQILVKILNQLGEEKNLELWIMSSPLVEVKFEQKW